MFGAVVHVFYLSSVGHDTLKEIINIEVTKVDRDFT
jgi:hypothetical protein